MKRVICWLLEEEITLFWFGLWEETTMKMECMECLIRAWLDILISLVTWVYLMTIVSWFLHHGTRLWDFGIWEVSRLLDCSKDMKRKSFLVLSLLITDKSFLQELIKESNCGIPEERTNSLVKKATIRIGLVALDTLLCWRTTLLTSVQLDGMAESRFGTPTSRSDAVSSIMMKMSTVWASPPMESTSPLPEPERSSESGMSPVWMSSPENSSWKDKSLNWPSTPRDNGLLPLTMKESKCGIWWATQRPLLQWWELKRRLLVNMPARIWLALQSAGAHKEPSFTEDSVMETSESGRSPLRTLDPSYLYQSDV